MFDDLKSICLVKNCKSKLNKRDECGGGGGIKGETSLNLQFSFFSIREGN